MKKQKKIWMIIAAAAAAVTALGIWLLWPDKEPDSHEIVAAAIQKTEDKDPFIVQIYSYGTVSAGDVSQTMQTVGYVYGENDLDYVSIYVNTSSETENADEADYDVTVAMYCDGEAVYDHTGSTAVRMDMTCEEFREIVSRYGLYHYDEADVTEITYTQNEAENYNGGQYTVTLTKPSDETMEAYAGILSDATGETVTKEDLSVLSAYVLYSIYDDEVVTQTCSFTVAYTASDGRMVRYSAVNQAAYLGSLDELELDISEETKEGAL